jgi:ElaB/YqjD/DUF883 family membrane-anchored ribosome-binding protein
MGIDNWATDATGEGGAKFQGSGNSTSFEKVKNIIAGKLHTVAEALNEKAADQGAECGMAHYRKQASEWLNQSADHIRQFDYEQADVHIREYVRQYPDRSLLMAGAIGLVIGAIMRRR